MATELPIACTLSFSDARTRQAEWADLLRHAATARTPVRGGVRVEFSAGEGVRDALLRLVALERKCCAFLDLNIEDGQRGGPVLTVTGPPEAEPLVHELFDSRSGARP